jgi:hypothetical protein
MVPQHQLFFNNGGCQSQWLVQLQLQLLQLSMIVVVHLMLINGNQPNNCWGFRLPHALTGGVLIVAQRRLSTLRHNI